MRKTTIKTASVLAFERKLACSDALMFSGNWQKKDEINTWKPILIKEKSVRGTISNRLKNPKSDDPIIFDAEIKNANLQTIDFAALPFDANTLKVTFTLRVLGNLFIPSVCNNQEYQKLLSEKINSYINEQKFSLLASRYAENLANGRFLWRNRVGAERIEIRVSPLEKEGNFDSTVFNLREFTSPLKVANLSANIQKGLLSNHFVLLKVEAYVFLGEGQEIFPSQELFLDKDSKKSKVLYQINGQAAIHSQKIGNALRTIDTWYPGAEELGPIAVEPYGAVTSRGKAYRQPKDNLDFYSLLDDWVIKNKIPELNQQHYVIANLIRGGVFGDSDKEKNEAE